MKLQLRISGWRTLFFYKNQQILFEAGCSFFFFFHFWEAEMFLTCSYFPDWTSQCHKEECQTEYNKNTISFLSFFFFQAVQIGSQWEVFYKKSGSATVLNPIKRYLQRSSIFHWSFTLQVCKSTKVKLLHRYFP